jgi:AraC-like DNA-binding protein
MKLIYENNSYRFIFNTPTNITFPAHMHAGLEIFLVEEGEILVTVGSCSQQLSAGDFAIAFPNQIHSYETDPVHNYNKSILILCPADISGDFLSTILKYHPSNPFITKENLHPDISYALHSLLQTPPDISDNLPIIRAYIQLVLSRLLPQIKLLKNRDNQPPGLTSQLITYLSEHYTEPVTLELLAKQLGVSKYSISRIFSEKLNTSFSDYLNTMRIDYAKLLLQGSDKDILSISLMCGYENQRTFNRDFKSICGCQPREYRRKRS